MWPVSFVSAKGPRTVGGLYSFNLAGGPVDVLFKNETNFCAEIKRVACFKNILASTDSGAYQVKVYDPVDKVVTVLVGSGQRGDEDGTAKGCTFVQPHGICTVGETIFVTDAVTGNVKLITELSGTAQFLKNLGLFYDSFGITCKGTNCTARPYAPSWRQRTGEGEGELLPSTSRHSKWCKR